MYKGSLMDVLYMENMAEELAYNQNNNINNNNSINEPISSAYQYHTSI